MEKHSLLEKANEAIEQRIEEQMRANKKIKGEGKKLNIKVAKQGQRPEETKEEKGSP